MSFFVRGLCLLIFSGLLSFQKTPGRDGKNWFVKYNNIGTFSSPRVSDLNGDGVGDVVLGAGREEFKACDSAVIALDGATGKMLWHVKAIDQIFGSASLKDINGDGTDDVIIF